MRRLILTTLALSFLAVPAAYAGSYQPYKQPPQYEMKVLKPKVEKKTVVKRTVVRPAYRIGKPLPVWQRKGVVHDYHRYGLRRPAQGTEWSRVGHMFLLINVRSGVVIAVR